MNQFQPNIVPFYGIYQSPEKTLFIMIFWLMEVYITEKNKLFKRGAHQNVIRIERLIFQGERCCEWSCLSSFEADSTQVIQYSLTIRDLACGDLLVHSNYVVKVADFGLTERTLYPEVDSRVEMPVRSTAPVSNLLSSFFW